MHLFSAKNETFFAQPLLLPWVMIPAVHVSTQIRVQDVVPVWNYVYALLLSPTEVSGVISVIEE